MIGQYTLTELLQMPGKRVFNNGATLCKRWNGYTLNYCCIESDGTWTNYDCKTTECHS